MGGLAHPRSCCPPQSALREGEFVGDELCAVIRSNYRSAKCCGAARRSPRDGCENSTIDSLNTAKWEGLIKNLDGFQG